MSRLAPSNPKHTNRLVHEASPYLLQHAHNPVDWHPWGPEAFEIARRENKPIFLSVGYSTCYWCHVMERQSFENERVAAAMNQRFVNIKVDREERPDVDQLYMTAVQALTRHGGWPMSVWLTPDLRPFYAGTYFPPDDAYGRPGFVSVLAGVEDAFRNRPSDVERAASQLVEVLQDVSEPPRPSKPISIDERFIEELIDRSTSDYEPRFGGFGRAPKFPRETLLELLLVHNRRRPNERRMKMLRHALDAMADGGIRDQLGGGFHRYSTDAKWLVPHFEIMLYDNAMLAWIYAEARRQTGHEHYAAVASDILDFTLREMTSPDGAFYTAFDAEVDAMEGASYLWTKDEIEQLLGPADAKLFNRVYGVDLGPNFADPHHGPPEPHQNILYLPKPMPEAARELGISDSELESRLKPMRQTLLAARAKRKQPLLDTKIITSWNALMIRAMAHAGQVLNDARYVEAAARAADFLLRSHRMADGRLHRMSRDGVTKHHGFLDDYAFLAQSLLALHAATGDARWRREAEGLAKRMSEQFADAKSGGFYFTSADAKDLIVRQKVAGDSPLPSGNAVAGMVLLEVGDSESAAGVIAAFAESILQQGESMSAMVQAATLHLSQNGSWEVASGETGRAKSASPVSAEAKWATPTDLQVRLIIAEGFHINSHDVSDAETPLIATNLMVEAENAVASVEYPPARAVAGTSLTGYEGEVVVTVRFDRAPASPPRLRLGYQACTDRACLAPAVLMIPIA